MSNNAITALISDELGEGMNEWKAVLNCKADGNIYGIPEAAHRVLKFNPVDTSITLIGPDFGDIAEKWQEGTEDGKGCIYCLPTYNGNHGLLKIDTTNSTVTELTINLPEQGFSLWTNGVLASDGNIYFMPRHACRILMLNTDTDTVHSVKDDLVGDAGWDMYRGAVLGIDGCIYGIPFYSKCIVKYDPVSQVTSYVGEAADDFLLCNCNGALARDGCIYAIKTDGKVLKIDAINDNYSIIGNTVESNHAEILWGDAIAGVDGCIYWPPASANRALKYDPHVDHTSLVGKNFGDGICKWRGGALASDGVIYCIPYCATRILAIDPFQAFTENLKAGMDQYPSRLGLLFEQKDNSPTPYEAAVMKFGKQRVFQLVVDMLPPVHEAFSDNDLYPFMVAAYPNGDLSVIYHMLREIPNFINRNNPS